VNTVKKEGRSNEGLTVIQSFAAMSEGVRARDRQRIVVAVAHDENILLAVDGATRQGLAEPVLIGRRDRIIHLADKQGIDLSTSHLIDQPDDTLACQLAVRMAREGKADAIMKGLVGTAVLLKAILNKETGIRDRELLSHIGLFFISELQRALLVTDAAMNIAPDLEAKKHLIDNAVEVLQLLGLELPKVACVCALEQVNPAMRATVEAAELVRLNRQGIIEDCLVGGPLALDNALFVEAARHKGITDTVAGQADILLMPNIEAGNVFYKSLTFLCKSSGAGLVVGAQVPVIVTSRSDNHETKLNSMILALYLAAMRKDKY
jgi:phosphate butyryltransferase